MCNGIFSALCRALRRGDGGDVLRIGRMWPGGVAAERRGGEG